MFKKQKQFLLLHLILFLLFNNYTYAQEKFSKDFTSGLFYLSEYIASSEFEDIKKINTDLAQVDSIFTKTLNYFNGDISETLLCLTFVCLPYNNIKVRFLFGSILKFPLPSPPQRIFNVKVKNLPKNLFIDSPQNDFGDKDKLAHFFGNAFLRYNFGWFNLSKFMGIFVEIVEEGLFVDGGFNRKDIIVNHLGELFGETLKENNKVLPSEALKIYQLLFFRYY